MGLEAYLNHGGECCFFSPSCEDFVINSISIYSVCPPPAPAPVYGDIAIIEKNASSWKELAITYYMSLKEEVNPNHSRQKNVPSKCNLPHVPFCGVLQKHV